MDAIRFGVFADFHYEKGMYDTTLRDLKEIFRRASEGKAELVLHCGDFCNDYRNSKEVVDYYLENSENLPVYGVYGNHELESAENSMEIVTPKLTNDKNVVWGSADGTIGDGSVAYYYFDRGSYRFIMLDTNYSFSLTTGEWEHNRTCSYSHPAENICGDALGLEQLVWLEKLLVRSAKEKKHCILVSHAPFNEKILSGSSSNPPDTYTVKNLLYRVNAMEKGTVIMVINGHVHTNHLFEEDGIVYFDVNSTKNAWWQPQAVEHYTDEHTFDYTEHDADGKETDRYQRRMNTLWMSNNTWFTDDPLSAIVSIDENGTISVDGTRSKWAYGIVPQNTVDGVAPEISGGVFEKLF